MLVALQRAGASGAEQDAQRLTVLGGRIVVEAHEASVDREMLELDADRTRRGSNSDDGAAVTAVHARLLRTPMRARLDRERSRTEHPKR
jgi:hypothetical protein